MRPPKGLMKGRKFSSRHSTLTDSAIPLIKELRAIPQISKIVLGRICHIRPGQMRIKFQSIPAGLKMTVRGSCSKQDFFLYTSDPVKVQKEAIKFWEEKRGKS